jgi:hypothetical protein
MKLFDRELSFAAGRAIARYILPLAMWGLVSINPAFAAKLPVTGADFDTDGKADPAEYSTAGGLLRICLSATGYQVVPFYLGGENCVPAAADYDGDRRADPAVFNTADGLLTAKLSAAGYASVSVQFAETNAMPVVADFDGDRRFDPTIFNEVTRQWTTMLSSAGYAPVSLVFGDAGSVPAAADYDGDGLTDPCVIDAANSVLAVKLSATGYLTILARFLAPSKDISVQAGDYDGDRLADPMVYEESSGNWYGLLSSYGYGSMTLNYGGAGWQAAAGDYSGDSQIDPAVYSATSAVVNVYFANGADVQGSFMQTNLLCSASTLKAVSRVNDEKFGVLYGKNDPNYYNLEYSWLQVISHGGSVLSDIQVYYQEDLPLPASAGAALAMDGAGEPHIFINYYSSYLEHLYRSGSTWSHENVGDLGNLSSSEIGAEIIARADAEGFIHVVATGWDENAPDTALLYYSNNRSGTWQVQSTSLRIGSSMWMRDTDFVLDSGGNAHVIMSFQSHPSEDVTWPGYIYYFSNQGGSWSSELALQQTHSSWDSYFPNISIAVNSAGQPALAAWLKYNVITGSDALSQLVYCYRNAPGSWSSQVLADTADNYFGTDGGHFTGIQPAIAVDSGGNTHIVFSDLASSHIGGYESAWFGQIRYARCTSGAWSISTLYPQSVALSQEIRSKNLLVSGNGRGMDVVATVYPGTNVTHFSTGRRSSFSFE